MTIVYAYDGEAVRRHEAPSQRPLRWAAWRPDGAYALLVGNRGEALRFDGARFERLATGVTHNLRGAGWSPDGKRALLAGNRGAVVLHEGGRFAELAPLTTENLRRVAWSPDGSCALLAGNGGCVLHYDAASGALRQLPGDRAHTLRCIAWRPDGAYALIGGYASSHAGYPRPYALFRCDGRYLQGILATDDEDDVLAVDWAPAAVVGEAHRAAVLVATYRHEHATGNKIVEYAGAGVRTRAVEHASTLLGAAWEPRGAYLLLCGEAGAVARDDGARIVPVDSGTRDNLVGPFWRPSSPALALMLRGPEERVYTI